LYGTLPVEGLSIAYREAGSPGSPKVVLLHGFPASSHQYRNLIHALASRFHVISPDYPGFGNSDLPDPAKFSYTFDRLSEITESFLKAKGFDRYGLFVQDYGGPVGFRVVSRRPEALEWLIIQNTNAYEVGFTEAWGGLRNALWKQRTAETEKGVAGLLEHGFSVHGATQCAPRADGPFLRLPHECCALPAMAEFSPQAAAQDPDFLGTGRYLLHPGGR